MSISQKIMKLRHQKNLTQEELAERIHVSPKTISSYETNRSLPNLEILSLLAKELETGIDDILEFDTSSTSKISTNYRNYHFKLSIQNFFLALFLFGFPILFFLYAGYVSIASFASQIQILGTKEIDGMSKITLGIFESYIWKYFLYIGILFCYFLLSKGKKKKLLNLFSILIFTLYLFSGFHLW